MTPEATLSATVYELFNYSSASVVPGSGCCYQMVPEVPGLYVNDTGIITGYPTQVGVYDPSVYCVIDAKCTFNFNINLTIKAEATIDYADLVSDSGQPFNYQVIVNNPPPGTITYSMSPGIPGLSINPATGLISGTPTDSDYYTITITLSGDNSFSVSQAIDITIFEQINLQVTV